MSERGRATTDWTKERTLTLNKKSKYIYLSIIRCMSKIK